MTEQAEKKTKPNPKICLTYFNIHGVGEPIRLAFTLAGVEFEDDRVEMKDWPARKSSTPYGQLPVMTVAGLNGDKPFAQSGAMLRYAGSLGDGSLYPKDDIGMMLKVEEGLGLEQDFRRDWSPALYMGWKYENYGHPKEWKEKDETVKLMRTRFVEEHLPKQVEQLESLIARNGGKFVCGDTPTIADCRLVPYFRRMQSGGVDHVPKDCLDKYEGLIKYLDAFLALPAVKAWYETH